MHLSPPERRSGGAADEYALHIDVESLYRQHMTETDRQVLLAVTPERAGLDALASPELEAAVFGTPAGATGPCGTGSPVGASAGDAISPFLTFAVAVHRTAIALESATFVEERVGPGRRIPVFDVAALSAMVRDPLRRYFFIELLASYTRVSSGVAWRRTARGWKRHRFSELDPTRLAGLLDLVTPEERAGIYRRLGDCSLFLLGVFPDHPPALVGAAADRLLRHSGVRPDDVADLSGPALFERLGASWYRTALRLAAATGHPATGTLAVAAEVADHFSDARRVLNAITDRYLFPLRGRWFPA